MPNILMLLSGIMFGIWAAVMTSPLVVLIIWFLNKVSPRISLPNNLNVGAGIFLINTGWVIYRLSQGRADKVAFYGNMIGSVIAIVFYIPLLIRYLKKKFGP